MANWNSGHRFNAHVTDGGFFWNNASYLLLINLHEVITTSDKISSYLAKLILSEKFKFVYDAIIQTAIYREYESIPSYDKVSFSSLFQITDSIGITEQISDLIVLAFLHEKFGMIESIREFAQMLANDAIPVQEITDSSAFLQTVENLGFADLHAALKTLLSIYDTMPLTDKEPRTAISDFIIGLANEYDAAYDWLLPFGLKIDWNASAIQVMPETELTTIEMPGIDGSIVEDAVYKDRLFQIVAFSEQGLTRHEKEELKTKIAEILDSTKHQSKKLTIQSRDISFDVRYEGAATISEGPSWVKSVIPFRAGPYGYRTFEEKLEGNGLVTNTGDAPMGVKITISGPIQSPAFGMGDVVYRWNGAIEQGDKLVIDTNLLTCYLVDDTGKKTNALAKLSGNFQKIPPHTSVVINASPSVSSKMVTVWRDKSIW